MNGTLKLLLKFSARVCKWQLKSQTDRNTRISRPGGGGFSPSLRTPSRGEVLFLYFFAILVPTNLKGLFYIALSVCVYTISGRLVLSSQKELWHLKSAVKLPSAGWFTLHQISFFTLKICVKLIGRKYILYSLEGLGILHNVIMSHIC